MQVRRWMQRIPICKSSGVNSFAETKKKRIQTPHREVLPYETDGHPLTEEQLLAINYCCEVEQAIKTIPAPIW